MDQKTIQSAGIISGVILIILGLMVSPVAIGLTISYPHELWWLGLVLCSSCGLLIYGGIQSIRKSKKQEWQAKEEEQRIREEIARLKTILEQPLENIPVTTETHQTKQVLQHESTPARSEVLAHWTFKAEEWKKFMMLERKRRKSSTLYESIAIVVFGTLVIMYSRDATFWIAFWISLILSLIIAALRYTFTMNSIGPMLPTNTVTITDQSVLINDKLNPYRSENFWLDKIQILDGDPDVLEFTYAWNTRKGKTFDEMRIPIPAGKRVDAQALIQKILNPSR